MAHLAETQTECSETSSELIQLLLNFALNSGEYNTTPREREKNRIAILTRMINTPSHVEGIMYMSGRVIPIISLRQKYL